MNIEGTKLISVYALPRAVLTPNSKGLVPVGTSASPLTNSVTSRCPAGTEEDVGSKTDITGHEGARRNLIDRIAAPEDRLKCGIGHIPYGHGRLERKLQYRCGHVVEARATNGVVRAD